jgi:hypothetical protein
MVGDDLIISGEQVAEVVKFFLNFLRRNQWGTKRPAFV